MAAVTLLEVGYPAGRLPDEQRANGQIVKAIGPIELGTYCRVPKREFMGLGCKALGLKCIYKYVHTSYIQSIYVISNMIM